jgi:hypothetical protein
MEFEAGAKRKGVGQPVVADGSLIDYRSARNERDSSVFERQVMCTSADYDIYAASCGMRMFRYSGRSPWMNVTFGTGWAQTRFA